MDDAASVNHSFESLKTRVAVTRDARYAAKKRLMRRNKRSYYAVSHLSLFVIILSVLPNVHQFGPIGIQWLLLITTVNSVFIIITTLIDAKEDYSLTAFHMQESARKLDSVFNMIVLATETEKMDSDWLRLKHSEYQDVLNSSFADHKEVDYIAVKVNSPHLFEFRWNGQKDFERFVRSVGRFAQLHYLRARWWFPHFFMVLFSLLLIIDLWDKDSMVFGVDILDDRGSEDSR